jgi:polysaccharide deacetylase family protein (PEP-CTERM system associated)
VLSFDVEEYFHVESFRGVVARASWDGMESRVAASTEALLELLAEAGVSATFFVLGWVARRSPEVVRAIADAGHEVASHGYGHELVYELTPAAFRRDVERARGLLSDLSGTDVVGYRAPTFSITGRNLWAFDVLMETGHHYDSSIFPIRHDRYGVPGFPREPVRIRWASGEALDEYPMATIRLGQHALPVAGGGYFRILPNALLAWAWRRLSRSGRSSVFYLHPWELDAGQPRIRAALPNRLRHYTGLRATPARLRRHLGSFSWVSFRDVRAGVPPREVSRESLEAFARGGPHT